MEKLQTHEPLNLPCGCVCVCVEKAIRLLAGNSILSRAVQEALGALESAFNLPKRIRKAYM